MNNSKWLEIIKNCQPGYKLYTKETMNGYQYNFDNKTCYEIHQVIWKKDNVEFMIMDNSGSLINLHANFFDMDKSYRENHTQIFHQKFDDLILKD